MRMINNGTFNMKYPLSKPDLSGKEKQYVQEAMETGWISSQGGFVEKFEKLFSKKHKAKHGVACSNGYSALVLALRACGIGEGDEVIVSDLGMVATAWAVTLVGATPVFVGCETSMLLDTRREETLDSSVLEEAITDKTKAIICTHMYGRQCNMGEINKLCAEYNLYSIEDSAQAHGIPLSGDIACFSMYANKILTAGEGGICITNNERLDEQMKSLRNMAFDKEKSMLHRKFAYNFRMTNLQAAVAFAQTERMEDILKKRKEIEGWYDKHMPKDVTKTYKDMATPMPRRKVLWMYDVSVMKGDRDPLMMHLNMNGIETRANFKPMRLQPMYKDDEVYGSVAYLMSVLGFYLPVYNSMTEADVKYICGCIKKYYAGKTTENNPKG